MGRLQGLPAPGQRSNSQALQVVPIVFGVDMSRGLVFGNPEGKSGARSMNGEPLDFNHVRDRRSMKHRLAETEREVKEIAVAALQNEMTTRGRVDLLEKWQQRSLLGRLRWMILGR